ncbi:putative bifunctional diguanylate cyclase/phosphodiesterase [Sphingomonas hengshuiensis]|uniref:putative bifunctional diguanylate cyclase/phosphodiesterase n=1 Tax=Sphingomonas hengshuiensis TaxID=1609977 RepID=UPI000B0E4E0C|nr:EAL domain-containing protein [Sphingomonas hengshuiensis]
MPRILRRLWSSCRDLLVAVLPILLVGMIGGQFNASEHFHDFIHGAEFVELDEYELGLLVSGLFYLGLLLRRTRRLRTELRMRRSAEQEAKQLADHDALTGLSNRRSLTAYIGAALHPITPGTMISVLAIDLDRFKPINDTYGHEGGDLALCTIANRIQKLVGERGAVARMGGDEFACVIRHPEGSALPMELAEAILHAVAKPIQLRGGLAEVSASIGVLTAAPGSRSAEDILGAADFAMYRAKRAGRSSCCEFVPAMEAEMRDRAQLELDMHAGINRGEFIPYFQPIVMLRSGEVTGFEALARWKHPNRGLIAPDIFIPIAEDAGMIQDLGFAVLRKACAEARHWPQHLTLSVNISPLQLNDPWLAQRILQVLCTTGFPAGRLIVEVTENRLVQDMEAARTILMSLKTAGIQVALDDFGTGYASLKHLRELAFNRIKIDRNFVQDMDAEENGQIVRAILSLSEGLGLPVTAEGIETDDNATALALLGCDFGQGYLFSRPVDAAAALLIARSRAYPGHGTDAQPPVHIAEPAIGQASARYGT